MTLTGNLTWGECMIFIGNNMNDYDQENPFRICVSCLINLLGGDGGFEPSSEKIFQNSSTSLVYFKFQILGRK